MDKKINIPIIVISNLRMGLDGGGVRSLIIANGCLLSCRYCLNDFCHYYPENRLKNYSVDELYKDVSKYKLYYLATNGGITFGGGEPLLYYDFILKFCNEHANDFSINIETSLNVNIPNLEKIAELINCFIVDIKDMNPEIYKKYTGLNNDLVLCNLKRLEPFSHKVILRVPRIPCYNRDEDVKNSIEQLKKMGYNRFDIFNYVVK